MKKTKIVNIIIFILISIISFAYNYEDYELFLSGKSAYEKGDYKTAEGYFDQLLRTYPNSLIIKNNYAYYYIGSNYNKLGNFDKATYYLEAAVFSYNTPIFTRTSFDKKNRYYMLRDFELGNIFTKLGDHGKAVTYFRRLDYGVSTIATREYEKKGLEAIKKPGDINDKYYKIKFMQDLTYIKDFKMQTLVPIGNYFVSMKEYDKAVALYDKMLDTMNLKLAERENIRVELIKALYRGKKYEQVVERGQRYINGPVPDVYHYYIGQAYQRMGKFVKAMEEFASVKEGTYKNRALLRMAGILYSAKRYQDVIDICLRIKNKNMFSNMMLVNSYLKIGNKKEFKKNATEFIRSNPNIYDSMIFLFILENEKIGLENYDSFLKMGFILDNYLNKLTNHMRKDIRDSSVMEANRLGEVAKLHDEELTKIEIENSSFVKYQSIENGYIITTVLESGGFYDLAYKNSLYYRREFFKYLDTIKLCYPKYYEQYVKKCSQKYDVPEVLLYSIMKNESGFNKEYVSDDSRVGLMALERVSSKEMDRVLSDPEYNIDIGARKMKEILRSVNGNYIKALIIYAKGKEYYDTLKFTADNDLDLDSLNDPQDRYELQELMITYMCYSKLYK